MPKFSNSFTTVNKEEFKWHSVKHIDRRQFKNVCKNSFEKLGHKTKFVSKGLCSKTSITHENKVLGSGFFEKLTGETFIEQDQDKYFHLSSSLEGQRNKLKNKIKKLSVYFSLDSNSEEESNYNRPSDSESNCYNESYSSQETLKNETAISTEQKSPVSLDRSKRDSNDQEKQEDPKCQGTEEDSKFQGAIEEATFSQEKKDASDHKQEYSAYNNINEDVLEGLQVKKESKSLNSPGEVPDMFQSRRKPSVPVKSLVNDVLNYLDGLEAQSEEVSREFRIISTDDNGFMKQPDFFKDEPGLQGVTSRTCFETRNSYAALNKGQKIQLMKNNKVCAFTKYSKTSTSNAIYIHKNEISHVESLLNKLQGFPEDDSLNSGLNTGEPEYSNIYEYYKFKLLSHSLSYLRRKSTTSDDPFYKYEYKKRVLRRHCLVTNPMY
ncbi:hypothetical protein TBLA_0H03090 [Henningerozyma blattae CBS 6284]|uniref:Uncharacterized protein n=1 Tax=Henningerozyma blattae (strain ATCC 34711 / CBS 6284 / DSM 70876 / NBRC 10599 / NRRL Y-10934 / UCD 77-7) TaxID=1071380 RepID=I2H888_HENB6|nr:hypothetical protein TBLA_0H03090 [Tetrapisispora blattae CBS 6284]CCH62590.1 hypothetical protein TBLA_0H03090 [Tetrapisispora blattae CBS 6284]